MFSCIRNLFKKKPILLSKLNLILFGPPGSGKGTQAKSLVDTYELLHISTGDLFRYEMGNNTPLGLEAKSYIEKGALVPDSVTIGMLKNKVEANLDAKGYIFDGFPRTIAQAEALNAYLEEKEFGMPNLVALNVEDEELVKRLLERGKTSGRKDDADESIIRNRIEVYKNETSPVYKFYDDLGKSITVEGVGSIDDIFARLTKVINTFI